MLNTYISACLVDSILGAGVGNCDLKSLGDVLDVSFTTKDVKFATSLTASQFETAYNNYVKAGKIIPLGTIFNFEQTTPDNETSTSSIGIKSDIRQGKPEFTFTYDKSHCFDNQIASLTGRSLNLIIHTTKGTLLTTNSDGDLKGFDLAYVAKSAFRLQAGTDPQQSRIMLQMSPIGAVEFDTNKKVLDPANLTFDPATVLSPLIVDISIVGNLTGSSITVDVKNACSGTPVDAVLADEAFWGLSDQAVTVTNATDAGDGRYTLTLSGALSAGDTQVLLTDGTYDTVTDANGVMYTGRSAIKTATV